MDVSTHIATWVAMPSICCNTAVSSQSGVEIGDLTYTELEVSNVYKNLTQYQTYQKESIGAKN